MIHGAHVVLYSSDADADRAFFRDVLEYPCVDAGHDLFLMCDDIEEFVEQMSRRGVECAAISTERWGSVTRLTLPSGATLGVYQRSHTSPLNDGVFTG
jgi:catechol 2,3-dioxygenase-like lactoylglutathione lyase family enzyme